MAYRIMKSIAPGALLLIAVACDMPAVNVRGTTDYISEHSKVVDALWDPEIAEYAVAYTLVSGEISLKAIPEYEPALIAIINGYAGYGSYWLMEKKERAEAEGNLDQADRLNKRAGVLFDRVAMYGRQILRLRDDGFDEALSHGWDSVEEWVADNFYRKEDAEVLTVTGLSFVLPMMSSSEGMAAMGDRPLAEMLLQRSVELNPSARHALALQLLGTLECSTPEALGGNPRHGLAQLEAAAAVTKRKSLGILVFIAERCAVALQDQKMYRRLLTEVIEAEDSEEFRLWNRFARYKAERLLKQEAELFFE
jgi:hypothetical protein